MDNNGYTPEPLDTSRVEIDGDLGRAIDQLSRNVHDLWAKQRMAEGVRHETGMRLGNLIAGRSPAQPLSPSRAVVFHPRHGRGAARDRAAFRGGEASWNS